MGLIIGGVLVALAIVGSLVLLLVSRSRRALRSWQEQTRPVYEQAMGARDLLLSSAGQDPAAQPSVRDQLEGVTGALDRSATSAPDQPTKTATITVAEALRSLAFALEAGQLLRSGTNVPTGEELAHADQGWRTEAAELDAALVILRDRIGLPAAKPQRMD